MPMSRRWRSLVALSVLLLSVAMCTVTLPPGTGTVVLTKMLGLVLVVSVARTVREYLA